MQTEENYRPSNIEFDIVSNGDIPENLGYFESSKEAIEFIASKLTAVNQKITVPRLMDNFEKNEIRKEYSELLETKLPFLEKELQKASVKFAEAKREFEEAKEYVNATTNEAKALAVDVRRGVKDISLDDQFTWRAAFDGRYYFYTFIDNQLKLCKVSDIPDFEKQNLWNAMAENGRFFKPENFDEQYLKDEIKTGDYAEKSGLEAGQELKDFLNNDPATKSLRKMVKEGKVSVSFKKSK
jgi:hypothetical protein